MRKRTQKETRLVPTQQEGIATDLLQAGVPKEDIVLAFQPSEARQFTEFAPA